MDLFKAIFAGSSDEASSSSSDGEANEEEDTKEEEETPNLFNITPTVSSSVTSSTTRTKQQTGRNAQQQPEHVGVELLFLLQRCMSLTLCSSRWRGSVTELRTRAGGGGGVRAEAAASFCCSAEQTDWSVHVGYCEIQQNAETGSTT